MSEPKFIERYGHRWPEGATNDLNIELACYREPYVYPTPYKPEYHFKKAWHLMWPKWEWNEWSELIVWAWCKYSVIAVIGHTRSSKSYTTSRCVLLDYLAAPPLTATTVTTTKFDSLKTRIWGDIMSAIETSALRNELMTVFKPTTTTNELKFAMRDKTKVDTDRYCIQGVATDSSDATAGKIRGQHSDRRRIIGDECEDMGTAIYTAITNARSAPDFKAALLTNPAEKISEFGDKFAKPANGWSSISDTDKYWRTVQPNGICLHFDGLASPNIRAGFTRFRYLLDQDYINEVRQTHGEDSLEWWMFVRGFPAPDGIVSRVWPSGTIEKAKVSCQFDFPPENFATLDPAYDWDDCVLMLGKLGRRRDGTPCADAKQSHKIKTKVGPSEIPKEYQIARQVQKLCEEYGVPPENYIQDETGNGRAVLAILRVEWSPKCQGISYGGEATKRPLRLNDPKAANMQVKYFVAELWFRASYLAQEGVICGLHNLDSKTVDDLGARRYSIKQCGDVKLMVIESKDEMKKRGLRSPDYGDTFCQIGELIARKGLLNGMGEASGSGTWQASRELAKRAQQRWLKEHQHGASQV